MEILQETRMGSVQRLADILEDAWTSDLVPKTCQIADPVSVYHTHFLLEPESTSVL